MIAGVDASNISWRSEQSTAAPVARPHHAWELTVRAAIILAAVFVLPGNFTSDITYYWRHGAGVSLHHLPYRDFLWEYPPVAAIPLVLVPLAHGSYACFLLMFGGCMAALEYSCFLLVRRTWAEHAREVDRWWHVLSLPLATITFFRLDFLAVLAATYALVALNRGRRSVGALALGIGAKLWPGVLVVALVARREWRQMRSLAVMCAVGAAAWFAFAPAGVRAFLRYRRGSGLQIESTTGAVLRLLGHRPVLVSASWVVDPGGWTWVEPLGLIAVASAGLAVAAGVGRWRLRDDHLVEFLGGCVIAVLLASRLFSPQFMAWVLPFMVVVAARGRRRIGAVCAAAVALTLLTMLEYRPLVFGSPLWALMPIVRNVLLMAVGWSLLRLAVVRKTP